MAEGVVSEVYGFKAGDNYISDTSANSEINKLKRAIENKTLEKLHYIEVAEDEVVEDNVAEVIGVEVAEYSVKI